MDGYIKLHRSILESTVFGNEKLLKLWIWCLCKASHTKHTTMIGNREVELLRGQFICSRSKASASLGLAPTTFNRLMHVLQDMSMIGLETDSKWTVVTIENYALYQDGKSQSGQIVDSKRTDNGQIVDTNKNDKKVKNDNNNINNINNNNNNARTRTHEETEQPLYITDMNAYRTILRERMRERGMAVPSRRFNNNNEMD